MLKHLAEGHTAFADKITLYLSDAEFRKGGIGGEVSTAAHDGFKDRFVFTVEGKKFHGMGSVNVSAEFLDPNGREVGADYPDARPVLTARAYCYTMGEDDPLTLRGIQYGEGLSWSADGRISDTIRRWGDDWRKPVPDAARAALRAALEKARELLLSLPDTEKQTVLRALRYAFEQADKKAAEATRRRNALDLRIARLETGE